MSSLSKRQKINVRIHRATNGNENIASDLNKFYVKFIEGRLNELNISNDKKLYIVDKIKENLKNIELESIRN